MKKLTISLCMIVKDEEKSIRKCLESVTGIVDEIIIVDTGSKDNTVDICNKYGAKVFHFDWVHDFAAARNFSIEQASSDYILILDADEYLMGEIKLQADLNREKDYYVCNIKNFNSIGRAFYHKAVRLFKNKRGLKYFGKLHEHLNTSDSELNLTQDISHTLIGHDGYKNEIVKEKNKLDRNFNILTEEVKNNPTGYNLYNMGQTLMLRMEFETALDYFKRAYKLSKDKTFALPLLNSMIECLQILKRYDEGIILGQSAVETYPAYTDFYFELGRVYEGNKYLLDAEMCYRKCLEMGDSVDQSFAKEGVGGYLTNYHLANLYFNKRDYNSAFDSISVSLQENKLYQPSLELYLSIMLRTNISNDEIIKHLNSIYSFNKIEEIKTILVTLCKTRHPILAHFIDALGEIFTDKELIAISQMYSGLYEEARKSCEPIEQMTKEYAVDFVLLAYLLKDETLLTKVKNVLNVNKNEWKFIRKLVKRDDVNFTHVTSGIEKILLQLCRYSIVLNEFNEFEYLSQIIFSCSIDAQYELAKLLCDFGFYNAAIDVINTATTRSTRSELWILLADIFDIQGQYEQALDIFVQLIKNNNDFSIYDRIYNLYEKLGEIDQKNELVKEMQSKFPLSEWVKQTIGSLSKSNVLEKIKVVNIQDKPAITIETRAYNVENYIEECIESVLNQSFTNFEWIILDNGSTDKTSEILQEYAMKDSRIKLFHNARNTVLYNEPLNPEFVKYKEQLTSEYWSMLDSDDYLHQDFLMELFSAAITHGADIAVAGTEMFNEENVQQRGRRCPPSFYTNNITELGDMLPQIYGSFRPIWGKLFKVSIMKEQAEYRNHNPINVVNGIDTLFCLDCLRISNSVVGINKALHYYRIRKSSVYHSRVDKNRYLGYKKIYEESIKLLHNWNKINQENLAFLSDVLYHSIKDCIDIAVKAVSVDLQDRLGVIENILTDNFVGTVFIEAGTWHIVNEYAQLSMSVIKKTAQKEMTN